MRWQRKKSKINTSDRRKVSRNDQRPVFSYYARGTSANRENTGRHETAADPKVRRSLPGPKYIPSYIAFTAVVVALAYACMLQPDPKIILINETGTIHRDVQVYQREARDIWNKSLLNRTKLTVSTGSLRQDIREQFSELADVRIDLPLLGHRPIVTLMPARPALRLTSINGAFFVDINGGVMARTDDIIQNDLMDVPSVKDESGISAESGKNILTSSEVSFLTRLVNHLKAENIPLQSITLPQSTANEVDVRLAGQQYHVKFSIVSDPRQAVGTYLATRSKLSSNDITPAEYIDVRVEEKAFYR